MKKRLLLLAFFSISIAASALEIPLKTDSTKKTKYSILLTGRIDAAFYTDSYKSIEQRDGLQYLMPARPDYDPLTGEDLNYAGQLRFNVASTRLGVGTKITFQNNISIDALIETDFMGLSSSVMQSLRLRHAYFRLNVKNTSILVGQTDHLAMVDQITPPTVTYGGASPINLQSRPIQIRVSQKVGKIVELSGALSMYTGDEFQMQAWAMTPDIAVRLAVGDYKKNVIGLVAGFKSIQPQFTKIVEDKNARMNAFYAAIFGRLTLGKGYAIRAYAIYGGDLCPLGLTGGFAPVANNTSYAAIHTVSTWIDFSTPRFKGFELGLFGGYQQNLGSSVDIDPRVIVGSANTRGVQNFWNIAPRVWYHFKMLSFGFEYMYSQALWAADGKWDDRYLSTQTLSPSRNNRYTLLARFTF